MDINNTVEQKEARRPKIGDVVYSAGSKWSVDLVACPVCKGKKWLLVKPLLAGDDEGHRLLCDCSREYPGTVSSSGLVRDRWSYIPVVEKHKIDRLLVTEGKTGASVEIHVDVTAHACRIPREGSWFFTEAEAQTQAERLAAEATAAHEQSLLDEVRRARDKCSWRAGYHMDQIKYHQRQLGLIEERAEIKKRRRKKDEKDV